MSRSVTLTIYLLKPGYSTPEKILLHKDSLTQYPVRADGRRQGMLWVKKPEHHAPNWLSFFEGNISDRLLNASTSAVYIISAAGQRFALVFGYGRMLLDPAGFEEQFGLKATLNAVGAERIRSVDRLRLDAGQHGRIQASKATTIGNFGLDIDQDLLRAVTGEPADLTLARHLTGRDALQIATTTSLATLPKLLALLHAEFRKTDYQQTFPWVDHIREVKDAHTRDNLDDQLLGRLQQGQLDGIWLAVPEIIDWTTIKGFTYRTAKSAPEHDDLHLRDFLAECRVTTIDDLKRRHTQAINKQTDQVFLRWPIYRCLYAEVALGADKFILTNATWYRIAPDFVTAVEATIQAIPAPTTTLPAFADADEEEYNQRVAADPSMALMDRKIITYPGGADKVELCDLYTLGREFIHIKRYGGSRPLSHLFAQGTVAAELFVQEPEFRRRANDKLPASHRLTDPAPRPNPAEYTVVFGIISGSANQLRLPFFSKVTLRNAHRRLTGLGYNVRLAKIPAQAIPQAARAAPTS